MMGMISAEWVGGESSVRLVRLNRPERANAFDTDAVADLNRILDEHESHGELRALVVTGAGKYFCSGGDLTEGGKPDRWLREIKRLFDRIESAEYVTIAAINGMAVGGGCELALACDLRVISEAALIGMPEVKFGGIAFVGGTQRTTRLVGPSKAKELHLFGELVDGREAWRIGLVNECVPADTELDRALVMAKDLAARPARSVRLIKWLIDTGRSLDHHSAGELESLVGEQIVMPALDAERARPSSDGDSVYDRLARGNDT
ncbi:enoyl-CoA hydratase/isomerase family protein [Actinophytocola sp.]|uniref:enoyl-CoA hydratase/isomerase family protein n=1 Tax=Actinophytocola sp. TaxID=1872138 RepID=UPI003D6A1AB8